MTAPHGQPAPGRARSWRRWPHPWHGTPAHPQCRRCQNIASRHGLAIGPDGLLLTPGHLP